MSYIGQLPTSSARLIGPGMMPEYGADYSQLRARDNWRVAYGDLASFLSVAYGTLETINVGGTQTIQRVVPLRFNEDNRLLATSINAKYKGWNRAGTTFTYAIIAIDYSTTAWDQLGQYAFVEITFDPEERTEVISASGVTIGGEIPAFDRTVWLPGNAYTFTVHNVPTPSDALYQSLYKNVNNATFRGLPAGTVLYLGASGRNMSKFGVTMWDITHKFLTSPLSWNTSFKRDGSTGAVLVNGSAFYPSSDLTQLFYV